MVKLPREPGEIDISAADLVDWPGQRLVRIHGTVGPHVLPWYRLRHFGPTPARFDPHPPPPAVHQDMAVLYAAGDLDTALAEVFQLGRQIRKSGPNRPYLTVWQPIRRLRLLDVTGEWPIRNGASHVLNTGPRAVCRRWSAAIAMHSAAVDGLLYTSSMTGGSTAALFLPAADSFPQMPELSVTLDHPGLVEPLVAAGGRIGYRI